MFDATQLGYQAHEINDKDSITCSFRQWRAQSHCHFIHTYKISVRVSYYVSESTSDSDKFSILSQVVENIKSLDGKLIIASDDPEKEMLISFAESQLPNSGYVIIDHTGCERMAEHIFNDLQHKLQDSIQMGRVTVMEHEANMGSFGVKGIE